MSYTASYLWHTQTMLRRQYVTQTGIHSFFKSKMLFNTRCRSFTRCPACLFSRAESSGDSKLLNELWKAYQTAENAVAHKKVLGVYPSPEMTDIMNEYELKAKHQKLRTKRAELGQLLSSVTSTNKNSDNIWAVAEKHNLEQLRENVEEYEFHLGLERENYEITKLEIGKLKNNLRNIVVNSAEHTELNETLANKSVELEELSEKCSKLQSEVNTLKEKLAKRCVT